MLFSRLALAAMSRARASGSRVAPWVKTKGHFETEIYRGRDHRFPAPQGFKYDTWTRFFVNGSFHSNEIILLLGYVAVACAASAYTMIWSLGKQEIWLNRAHRDPPWDWSRLRTNYWLNNSRYLYLSKENKEHYRMRKPMMEALNDEMLEEAIKIGTRNPDGSTKQGGHH